MARSDGLGAPHSAADERDLKMQTFYHNDELLHILFYDLTSRCTHSNSNDVTHQMAKPFKENLTANLFSHGNRTHTVNPNEVTQQTAKPSKGNFLNCQSLLPWESHTQTHTVNPNDATHQMAKASERHLTANLLSHGDQPYAQHSNT